jgi:hypothetical protein
MCPARWCVVSNTQWVPFPCDTSTCSILKFWLHSISSDNLLRKCVGPVYISLEDPPGVCTYFSGDSVVCLLYEHNLCDSHMEYYRKMCLFCGFFSILFLASEFLSVSFILTVPSNYFRLVCSYKKSPLHRAYTLNLETLPQTNFSGDVCTWIL